MCQVISLSTHSFIKLFRIWVVTLIKQEFGYLYRRPRGMYVSTMDKGEIGSIMYNWPGSLFLHPFLVLRSAQITWLPVTVFYGLHHGTKNCELIKELYRTPSGCRCSYRWKQNSRIGWFRNQWNGYSCKHSLILSIVHQTDELTDNFIEHNHLWCLDW